jgi:phenylpropionate dioxygenase-like ring-hydroxylating dioxygenase large terminal subunit
VYYESREMPSLNRQGEVTNAVCSSHGDDMEFDGTCLTAPQPYEGERETSSSMMLVPSECGLKPQRPVPSRNPMVGFHAVHGVEAVKC